MWCTCTFTVDSSMNNSLAISRFVKSLNHELVDLALSWRQSAAQIDAQGQDRLSDHGREVLVSDSPK